MASSTFLWNSGHGLHSICFRVSTSIFPQMKSLWCCYCPESNLPNRLKHHDAKACVSVCAGTPMHLSVCICDRERGREKERWGRRLGPHLCFLLILLKFKLKAYLQLVAKPLSPEISFASEVYKIIKWLSTYESQICRH